MTMFLVLSNSYHKGLYHWIPDSGSWQNPNYRKISNITRTKSKHLNTSRIILQLSMPNPLKPGDKSRMKMWLEPRRQAMLQLHLIDQYLYRHMRCAYIRGLTVTNINPPADRVYCVGIARKSNIASTKLEHPGCLLFSPVHL